MSLEKRLSYENICFLFMKTFDLIIFLLYGCDDDDDELFFVVWLTDKRRLALYPAGTIPKDLHHCGSALRREQDVNLWRTGFQTLTNEIVQ